MPKVVTMLERPAIRRFFGFVLALGLTVRYLACGGAPQARVATFNIENYPQSEQQEKGAFQTISSLDVAAVGVQEITNTKAFAKAAQKWLGSSWKFVSTSSGPSQKLGVLYDSSKLKLLSSRTLDDTVVYEGAR